MNKKGITWKYVITGALILIVIFVILATFNKEIQDVFVKILGWLGLWKVENPEPITPVDPILPPKEPCYEYDTFPSCYDKMDKKCMPIHPQYLTAQFQECKHCDDLEVKPCSKYDINIICNNNPCGQNCIWIQGWRFYKWSIPVSGKCFDHEVYDQMQQDLEANGIDFSNIEFAEGQEIEQVADTSDYILYKSEIDDYLYITKRAIEGNYYVFIKERNKPAVAYDSKGNEVPDKQQLAEDTIGGVI